MDNTNVIVQWSISNYGWPTETTWLGVTLIITLITGYVSFIIQCYNCKITLKMYTSFEI